VANPFQYKSPSKWPFVFNAGVLFDGVHLGNVTTVVNRPLHLLTSGRVAQPLNRTDTTTTVGAPSFAHFAKGGNHERMRNEG
jgi:hypothetical protein